MGAVVRFLDGGGCDAAGRSLDDVLAYGPQDLEARHDFIQWLFPLTEASAAVPGSPVLSALDVETIRTSARCQAGLARAAERMGRFFDETDHWMRASDHNHLRITRIIKSLRRLAGDRPADRFKKRIIDRVEATRAPVNAVTLGFWREA